MNIEKRLKLIFSLFCLYFEPFLLSYFKLGGVFMTQMYSSCTVCYEPLTEEDTKVNIEKENYYFPVCKKCLSETSIEIDNALKK